MMSTPEVAFLTGHGPFAAGISVTASHNPATDNGIKIFGKDGRKLPGPIERMLEDAIARGRAGGDARPHGNRFGWLQLGREKKYEEFIIKSFRKSFATLKKRRLSVVFDLAYGARSIDLQVLSQLAHSLAFGRTVPEYRVGSALVAGGESAANALDIFFMNAASPTQPETHHLINVDCGSLHPQGCARAVRELKADLGVCFDGDGDRCILVDETGQIRDGDHILAVLAADMKARDVLKNDLVVSTSMANLGLDVALKNLGVRLMRTDVGDRHVSEAMTRHGAVLGGEQSGHVILADEGHLAGDGLYTALRVIEIMLDGGRPLGELCAGLRKYPQTIVNVPAPRKPPLAGLKNLGKLQARHQAELGAAGRVNVRYSGTEPLLRIMVEAESEETVRRVAGELAAAARKDLA
jgi:phosphoglucosamine mutase